MATKKTSRAAKIRAYFATNPTATTAEVAKKFKTTYQIAYMAKKSMDKEVSGLVYELTKGRRAAAQKWEAIAFTSSDTPITMEEPAADPVNHQLITR